jgi:hypothetical protein
MAKKVASSTLTKDELDNAVAAEIVAAKLEQLLKTQQLLGDPRVRVQVSTDEDVEKQPHSFSMSRRYSVG